MISIRFYNDSDYDEVKEILQEGNLFDEVWEERKNLQAKIKRDSESILVAEDDGKMVGCVFIVEDGWTAFIWRLAVKGSYRNKGVGSLLMEKAEQIIKKRGIKESSLFVDSKNDSLKKWYASKGYLQTSDYTFFYKKL